MSGSATHSTDLSDDDCADEPLLLSPYERAASPGKELVCQDGDGASEKHRLHSCLLGAIDDTNDGAEALTTSEPKQDDQGKGSTSWLPLTPARAFGYLGESIEETIRTVRACFTW